MATSSEPNPELARFFKATAQGKEGDKHLRFIEDPMNFLAHYTSVDSLKKIADSGAFYMRNARLMNDTSEIRHGFYLIYRAFEETEGGKKYLSAWSDIFPNAQQHLKNSVLFSSNEIAANCFLLSMCQHREPDDAMGKLSMWRAYGGGDIRVAVIADPRKLLSYSNSGILATPVIYGDLKRVNEELDFRAELIAQSRDLLKNQKHEDLSVIASMLTVCFGVAIKHPGFTEEQEWRFVYMPAIPSGHAERTRKLVVLGGVPQIVYQLPFLLPSKPEFREDRQFLKKLILGPCAETETVTQGLVALVESYGFTNAREIVTQSGIPYRQRM